MHGRIAEVHDETGMLALALCKRLRDFVVDKIMFFLCRRMDQHVLGKFLRLPLASNCATRTSLRWVNASVCCVFSTLSPLAAPSKELLSQRACRESTGHSLRNNDHRHLHLPLQLSRRRSVPTLMPIADDPLHVDVSHDPLHHLFFLLLHRCKP